VKSTAIRLMLIALAFLAFSMVHAEDEAPVESSSPSEDGPFELGLGVAGLQIPHYMGSAHYYQVVFPFPYVIPKNQFSKTGGEFFDIEGEFEMRLPVEGDHPSELPYENFGEENARIYSFKNYARRGMDYVPLAVFPGLSIVIRPLSFVTIKFPFYWGLRVKQGLEGAGNMFIPQIKISTFMGDEIPQGFGITLVGRAHYTDKLFNHTYYGVTDEDVAVLRPRFDADKEGFLGFSAGAFIVMRFGDLTIMAGGDYSDMTDSIMKDSPLVETAQTTMMGVGFAYSFFEVP
jgi:outer membrane scaffolding protein for murein synthesis (MipA/OmpV family)